MLNQDIMREATRLTRSGQLAEATALLQRMLRGDDTPADIANRTGAARAADHRGGGNARRRT